MGKTNTVYFDVDHLRVLCVFSHIYIHIHITAEVLIVMLNKRMIDRNYTSCSMQLRSLAPFASSAAT